MKNQTKFAIAGFSLVIISIIYAYITLSGDFISSWDYYDILGLDFNWWEFGWWIIFLTGVIFLCIGDKFMNLVAGFISVAGITVLFGISSVIGGTDISELSWSIIWILTFSIGYALLPLEAEVDKK